MFYYLRNGSYDFPIHPRHTVWRKCSDRLLSSSLHVDVGALLLGVGRARQDHIGQFSPGIAMMTLEEKEDLQAFAISTSCTFRSAQFGEVC